MYVSNLFSYTKLYVLKKKICELLEDVMDLDIPKRFMEIWTFFKRENHILVSYIYFN
ncbi:hypothetical protein Scep_018564 [Stephania cephalantha]|uniref:Uncharacterized protein n=1 Tax=Stephania cephalantha TaxID=152367 RepID=A0AAP0I9C9_9MAGN